MYGQHISRTIFLTNASNVFLTELLLSYQMTPVGSLLILNDLYGKEKDYIEKPKRLITFTTG